MIEILIGIGVILYIVLGVLFNSWAFSGDIKKFRWLLSQSSEIYTLYKLLVVLALIVIFILFSPVFFLVILSGMIVGYFKRRKMINQITTLEEVVRNNGR